jgi:hypothetical protein
MLARIGPFRGFLLALCVLACGCPNWNIRGRARTANPPASSPELAIQTPPQPGPAEPAENKPPLSSKASETAASQPSLGLEKQNPEVSQPPIDIIVKVRTLHRQALQRVLTMDSYSLRLKRREVVQGKNKPDEIIFVKFRKEPFSVYLKWLGPEGNQREAIYVKGRYDNKIHTKLAAGDVFLMPAGTRFSLAPDNPLVLANSRHPITEAGFAHLVDQFGLIADALEKGDARPGTVQYQGILKRPEIDNQVEEILQIIPPGADALLPKGGQRLWFFDTIQNLPVLIITRDETGQEVEFYCHDQITPLSEDEDAFNPDRLWGKK